MTNILVVHHDADLYGADKSLLHAVRAFKAQGLEPIVTVPHMGPLVDLLRSEQIEVHIGPVGKLTRQVMRPSKLPQVLRDIRQAMAFMDRVVGSRPVALVYTNSIAAIGGAVWAARRRLPRLWHVREIVVAPAVAATGFPLMLQWLGGWCVCNSNATRDWLVSRRGRLAQRSSVIWNGLEGVADPDAAAVERFRAKLGLQPQHVLATLVGRINRWKGQGVFIDAAARIQGPGTEHLRFLIVGDVADGQHHFRESMLEKIRQLGLQDRVLWHPFTPDVDVVWKASDIAVVPSIEPEPFGRVAIEAMAHRLPVVAAGHGGLAEIVDDQRTGLLVPPADAEALAAALLRLGQSGNLRREMGHAGLERQRTRFSQLEHDRQLTALVHRLAGA